MYAISKCVLARLSLGNSVLKICFSKNQSNNVGVERGVAARRAQMVWPMMTVTVTNFEGFTRQQCCKNVEFGSFSSNESRARTHTDGIHITTNFMCTKFDILNHDGFLISGGCRSVKFQSSGFRQFHLFNGSFAQPEKN